MSKNRRSAKNNRLPNGQFPKGTTGNAHGRPRLDSGKQEKPYTQADVKKAIAEVRLDAGWYNLLSQLGTEEDKSTGHAMSVEPVTDQEARLIYRGDSFGARVADARPREMFRAGWKLKISDADVEKKRSTEKDGAPIKLSRADARKVKRRLDALASKTKDLSERAMNRARDLELNAKLKRALVLANVDGGSALLIGANDGAKKWSEPLKLDALRREDQLAWLTVVEARHMAPVAWYNNPRAPKYGEVAIWRINASADGLGQGVDNSPGVNEPIEVHETRLIVFQGIKLTNSQVEGTLSGFGDSLYTRLKGTLSRYHLGWNSAAILLNEFSLAAMKIKGLAEMASQDGQKKLLTRMRAVKLGRSIVNMTLLDKDEELVRDTASVAGLADLLFALMQELAGEADVPVTILMGMSPAGLNATGESDIRGWYDRIASEWIEKMDPVMRRLIGILLRTINGGKEPEKWCVDLNPLWQESPKEKAETRKLHSATDQENIANGLYSAEEARRSRFGGDEYGEEINIDTDDVLETDPAYEDPDMPEAQKMKAEGALDPKAGTPSSAPVPGATGQPAGGTDIQKQAMNGAQVTSLIDVVKAAVGEEIPREAAQAIIEIAFQLSAVDAARVLGPEGFKAKAPEPAVPFGGGFGAKPPAPPALGDKPEPPKPGDVKPDEKAPPVPPKAKLDSKRSK